MTKISLAGRSLQFIESMEYTDSEKNIHVFQYKQNQNLHSIIALIENHAADEHDLFYILSDDSKKTEIQFKSYFKLIEAAGGVVKNSNNELLFIFRNGKWDLPKGKVEENERIEKAALREVSEECGIHQQKIVRALESTYHTYILKEKRILKKTYWFEMYYEGFEKLVPQQEEGITDIQWMSWKDSEQGLSNSYETVRDVISSLTIEPGN